MLSDASLFKSACLGDRACQVQSQGQTASVMPMRNVIMSCLLPVSIFDRFVLHHACKFRECDNDYYRNRREQ